MLGGYIRLEGERDAAEPLVAEFHRMPRLPESPIRHYWPHAQISALPDGPRYLGWLATSTLHTAEATEAYPASHVQQAQAKAWQVHKVLDQFFRRGQGE